MWVIYEPHPKNIFVIKVNGEDIYSLIKEELDFDPTKTETLKVYYLKVNDIVAISGPMPWIINDVEEKIQDALGMGHLHSIDIRNLETKSFIANELLDALSCYDLPEQGLQKLSFNYFSSQCSPFEEEVMSRLANMCFNLSHLQLSMMYGLSETAMMSIVSLFRQIVQQNPPIEVLNMYAFIQDNDIV